VVVSVGGSLRRFVGITVVRHLWYYLLMDRASGTRRSSSLSRFAPLYVFTNYVIISRRTDGSLNAAVAASGDEKSTPSLPLLPRMKQLNFLTSSSQLIT
jgi:hypothetical protein